MTKQAVFLVSAIAMISFSSCAVSNQTPQPVHTDLERGNPVVDSAETSVLNHTDISSVNIVTQITDTILGSQTNTITDQSINAIDVIETYLTSVLSTTTTTSVKSEETFSL